MARTRRKLASGEARQGGRWARLKVYLKTLGPGLITGASDDDPSGIGTYAQTGAQFGYSQLWMALFTFPLMAVTQEMCARIGQQTGTGLAEVIRRHYPRPVLYLCVALLFLANSVNLGADLGAMAAAAAMIVPLPAVLWLVVLAVATLVSQIFVSYRRYSRFLRFLTFSLFAYVVVAFVVHTDWPLAFRQSLIPSLHPERDFLLNLIAVLGTTISPYLFFWQASVEVEEEIDMGRVTLRQRRGISRADLRWMRTDVVSGMLLSNVVMWFIIATAAATFHKAGVTQITGAPQAAQQLQPLVGPYAGLIFAAGILGTGLLAVPVLAGSAAYALADTFRWPHGLSLRFREALRFYGIIAVSTLAGVAINFLGVPPMRALYYTAVLNGLVAPPLLVMLMLISNSRRIMHDHVNGRWSNLLGWATTAAMTAAGMALLIALAAGH